MAREYADSRLRRNALPEDPFLLFANWSISARETEPWNAEAAVLATADAAGYPSARVILVREAHPGVFCLYTNYTSQKGRDLEENPHCSLVFWWSSQVRQVRIQGAVRKLPGEQSDDYFCRRPRGSRIGAWASPQSRVIAGREALEASVRAVAQRFEGQEIPRPAHWGGYQVCPIRMEFWQGGRARLHDRFLYERDSAEDIRWTLSRLAP